MNGLLAVGALGESSLNPFMGFSYIILFLGVLWLAWQTTKWVSKGYTKTFGAQIKLVDKLPMGLDKSFIVVKVGEKHYFMYQDRNGIKMLDRLNDFKPAQEVEAPKNVSFQELFERLKGNR